MNLEDIQSASKWDDMRLGDLLGRDKGGRTHYYASINVSPHPPSTRDRVGNFPCLEWQACPARDRDIESLKCACETHAAHVPSRFEF